MLASRYFAAKINVANATVLVCHFWRVVEFYFFIWTAPFVSLYLVRDFTSFKNCWNAVQNGVVIRPITFRSDWSYFMNFWVIGLIKVVPAVKFRSDWSYKSQIRKNDLLQILCFEKTENFFSANTPNFNFFFRNLRNFRVIGLIAVVPAQKFFEWLDL